MQLAPDDRSGKVLVVHPDRKAQRTLQRILAATLRPVECVEAEVAAARAAEQPGTLVVIDIAVAKATPTMGGGPCWIALPGDEIEAAKPDDVAVLLEAGWQHVLGVPMGICHDELAATAQKLLRRDVFGLEKYVGWSAAVRTVTLEDALDRPAAVAALVAGVADAGLSERIASLASVIADELLANAIYDAPPDGAARSAPRDQSRRLDGRAEVRLRWACDARHLAVEVTDRWGTLDPALPGPLIARSARRAARAGGSHAVASADDHGGMGLALAYACCHQLAIAVAPGACTEVIALLDVRNRPADLGRAPSFHVFTT